MTICPKCEKPIRDGRARGEFIVDFKEDASGILHGVKLVGEVWIAHEMCLYAREGD